MNEFQKANVIDVSILKRPSRHLDETLIAPPNEAYDSDAIEEHSAEPIKSMEDIINISKYLIQNERYRDNMLFIVGINFGLRVSDLRMLRFSDIINPQTLTFKDRFPVFEIKTRNTRKKKKNRYITINDAVVDAVTLFLQHTSGVSMSDFLFRSQSNRNTANAPLTNKSIDRILKGIAVDLKLSCRVSTHTLRKTFCYHQMLMSNNDGRKLLLLQKMLNHSTPAQTLDYIGITQEEIEEAYKCLNLGSEYSNYMVDTKIIEEAAV